MKRRWIILVVLLLGSAAPAAAESELAHRKAYELDRTAWMKGKWGMMTHYLLAWQARENRLPATVEQWNKMVDAFDVEGLADQIKSTGASYHLLTIGQGTPHLITPSPLYDELFVDGPSNCAKRDLVLDMANALQKRGIRLMVYSTCGGPGGSRRFPPPATGSQAEGEYRNKPRMLAWEKVITQWSLRWGDKVSGWWLDGCYTPNRTFNYPDAPNFESLAAACRAGNPMAAVTFNRGVMDRPISITPFEDYTGGEINDLKTARLWRIVDGKVDGARLHLLSYLGQKWGIGEPRYEDLTELVIPRTLDVLEFGGCMTWDVPIQPSGLIADQFMAQLKAIGQAIAAAPKGDRATLVAARVKATQQQLQTIAAALDALEVDIGRYPATGEGLELLLRNAANETRWKGPYLKPLPRDVFGTPFRYVFPSKRGAAYDLLSAGADREFGTGDDIYR